MLLLNGAANKVKIYKNKKDKLPFAVFIIFDNKNTDVAVDYKEIFTDIISDRIKQKYKQLRTNFRKNIDKIFNL